MLALEEVGSTAVEVMEVTGCHEETSAGKVTWCNVVSVPWAFPCFTQVREALSFLCSSVCTSQQAHKGAPVWGLSLLENLSQHKHRAMEAARVLREVIFLLQLAWECPFVP